MIPKLWCITTTEESNEEVCNWYDSYTGNKTDRTVGNHYVMEEGIAKGFMYHAFDRKKGYTEISFEDFKKYVLVEQFKEQVNHPDHYGGKDNVYEVIKIIEHFGLCFHLGNLLKYVLRCGKKDDELQELKKARWYLDRKIQNLENKANSGN